MLELIVGIMAVAAMSKIASVGSLFLPMPFLRVGLAFILAFGAMIGYKIVSNK